MRKQLCVSILYIVGYFSRGLIIAFSLSNGICNQCKYLWLSRKHRHSHICWNDNEIKLLTAKIKLWIFFFVGKMDYGSPKTLQYQSESCCTEIVMKKWSYLFIHCTCIHAEGDSCTEMLLFSLSLSLSLYSYRRDHPFTAVASHPSKLCIATGNRRGEIQLW